METFKNKRNVDYRAESQPDIEVRQDAETLALEKYDPIVVPGFQVAQKVMQIAQRYPNTTFVPLIIRLLLAMYSVLFQEQEGELSHQATWLQRCRLLIDLVSWEVWKCR